MKFAVVGSNTISDSFALAVTKTQSEIVAVYSRTAEAGGKYQSKWGIKTLHTDFDEMLANPEVEGVYIATPNSLHHSQAVRVLNGGKHLLLEKPATLTAAEFDELTQIAKDKNLVFLEAMKPHFLPTYHEMKKSLAEVGTIRRASINFCRYSTRYDNFKKGIIENAFIKQLGNGALMDIGVYPIAVMVMLFGKPEKVIATGEILDGSIDITGTIICKYDGFNAVVSYSKVSSSYQPNEIEGEDGSILFENTSRAKCYTIKKSSGETEKLTYVYTDDQMIYEINQMDECTKTPSLAIHFNKMTKIALEIMEEAREQMGYFFR
ncbi:MAG: Gfo/Idh/MocA family oxidoreductase [Bacillota bacterium]